MEPCRSFSRIKPQKLGYVTLITLISCVIIPTVLLALLKSSSYPMAILNLQLLTGTCVPSLMSKESSSSKQPGSQIEENKIICELSDARSDTCSMHGDVRVVGNSSFIIMASSSQPRSTAANTTWKIRPYARKWETPTMQNIKEISLKSSSELEKAPHCSLSHSIPAIVFSTGGFVGNFFHDFTDVLIPLFITSRQYQGKVQFLVVNFNNEWVHKYQLILKQLSRHEIINMDTDMRVHCFQQVHVGLKSHKVLGIDPSKSPKGYSMTDFKDFLRSCFSLPMDSARRIQDESRKKPRLLILLRDEARSLTNERETISLAQNLGYEVVAARPEETKNLTLFARVVNSCDVMMGVHGAGLTNMIFLPVNATIIQIIPWGGLKNGCRYLFGEPARDMGISYVDYEISEEESSLIDQYPRDHPVFTDPLSIHKQGWGALWTIFLYKQKVKLDVGRFSSVLLGVLQSLK